jgi:hypothetical protein
MPALTIAADGSIKLPNAIRRRFPRASQLAVWTDGEVIVLKRMQPLKPSEIVARAAAAPPPLAEIDAEVQRVRKAKRRHRA